MGFHSPIPQEGPNFTLHGATVQHQTILRPRSLETVLFYSNRFQKFNFELLVSNLRLKLEMASPLYSGLNFKPKYNGLATRCFGSASGCLFAGQRLFNSISWYLITRGCYFYIMTQLTISYLTI